MRIHEELFEIYDKGHSEWELGLSVVWKTSMSLRAVAPYATLTFSLGRVWGVYRIEFGGSK